MGGVGGPQGAVILESLRYFAIISDSDAINCTVQQRQFKKEKILDAFMPRQRRHNVPLESRHTNADDVFLGSGLTVKLSAALALYAGRHWAEKLHS